MLRQTNTQSLADETLNLRRRRLATVHEIPQPRARGTTSAVPKFIEVSAPRKWNRLGASALIHFAALFFLVRLAVWLPKEAAQLAPHREVVTLIAPVEKPVIVKPVPTPPPKVLAQLREEPRLPASEPEVVTPKMQTPIVKPTPAPEAPKVVAENTSAPMLPKPAIPKKVITEGMFDSGSSAKPTIKAAVREVQTGGFGDPNGVAGKSNSDRKLTVAAVGAFDLPSGPGTGNGAGGVHGKQGVIASAGFGDGMAGLGSGDRNPARGAVSTGGFGEAATAEPAPKRATRAAETTPVEILSKPRPQYTADARQAHIEGEVVLDVMFGASGDIRVLRIVRGLGHGLDESAQRAAQQIRFNPAKRDGQPYDSNAVVHIVFALAE